MLVNSKNLELKKHVGTIHSSGAMSLLQRKIANGLLFNAYDELLVKEEHQVSIRDLCTLIGYDSHDIRRIKEALIDLLSTVVEWNLVDKDSVDQTEGTWNASSIIADASLNGSICSYSYSNKMKKLLYHPSIYGKLNMAIQAKFKSGYGLALYENCIRYQNLKSTQWFDLLVFRKLMGVGEGKYIVFAEFKKRVLNIAIKEVNSYSPITVIPEVQKRQNSVVSIRFLITRKLALTENVSDGEIQKEVQEDVRELMRKKLNNDFGMSHNQIVQVLSKHDDQYISSKIELIHSSPSFLNGKIKNLAKYLLDALEKDYKMPKSSKEITSQKDMEAYNEQTKKDLQEKLTIKYEKYVRLKILDNLKSLEKSQKDLILQEFLNANKTNYELISVYHKRGLLNGYVTSKFITFVKEQKAMLLDEILSFERYCDNE